LLGSSCSGSSWQISAWLPLPQQTAPGDVQLRAHCGSHCGSMQAPWHSTVFGTAAHEQVNGDPPHRMPPPQSASEQHKPQAP
jgi:hypothetical protein